MKRAGRWLFNFAAAVSLVLCAATVLLALRSYWINDWLMWADGNYASSQSRVFAMKREISLNWGNLRYTYVYQEPQWFSRPGPTGPSFSIIHGQAINARLFPLTNQFAVVPVPPVARKAFNIERVDRRPRSNDRGIQIDVSMWLLAALTILMPAFWAALALRRRTRVVKGMCPVCGYDLRATPQRCPECGAIPEAAKGAVT